MNNPIRQYSVESANVNFELNQRVINFDILQRLHWKYPTAPCYEPDVAHVMTRFIHPGDHVIDAGANWGYHTLMMSRLVGDEGVVWAIEPDKYASQFLTRNIEKNNVANIRFHDDALWHGVEEKNFSCRIDDGSSSFVHSADQHTVIVKKVTTTLDDLTAGNNNRIRFLKIDCEGSELAILEGAKRLLAEGIDAVVVEINHTAMGPFNWTVRDLRNYMESLGYEFFLLNTSGLFPMWIPPGVEFDFEGCILNVLFSRTETLVKNWPTTEITSVKPIFMSNYMVINHCVYEIGYK